MKKILVTLILLIVCTILCLVCSSNKIIVSKDHFNKNECIKSDPLTKKIYIPKIQKNKIETISITISAKDSDTITYNIQSNNIKEHKNGIIIPVKYLIADKKANIEIAIKKKDGSTITKKTKIKVNIKNNENIIFYNNDIVYSTKNLPTFIVKKNQLQQSNKLFYALLVFEDFEIDTIFDTYGNIRGLFYIDKSTFSYNDYIKFLEDSNIYNFTYRESIKNKYNEILVICSNNKDITTGDKIAIVNTQNKTFNIIDLKKSLKIESISETDGDWIHTNSIYYDDNDKSIIVSARNIGIFKISINGNLKWLLLTNHKSNYSKHLKKYLLTATDLHGNILSEDIQNGGLTKDILDRKSYAGLNNEIFDWPLGQHCVKLIDKNHIVCFDNGALYIENNINIIKNYSRVVIYEIDETKKTVKQVWQYGKKLGKHFFSIAYGYIEILDDNRLLILSPLIIKNSQKSKGTIRIINIHDNNISFDMDIRFKNLYKTDKKDEHYDNIKFIKLFDVK